MYLQHLLKKMSNYGYITVNDCLTRQKLEYIANWNQAPL